jgi:hypothetical protein
MLINKFKGIAGKGDVIIITKKYDNRKVGEVYTVESRGAGYVVVDHGNPLPDECYDILNGVIDMKINTMDFINPFVVEEAIMENKISFVIEDNMIICKNPKSTEPGYLYDTDLMTNLGPHAIGFTTNDSIIIMELPISEKQVECNETPKSDVGTGNIPDAIRYRHSNLFIIPPYKRK